MFFEINETTQCSNKLKGQRESKFLEINKLIEEQGFERINKEQYYDKENFQLIILKKINLEEYFAEFSF